MCLYYVWWLLPLRIYLGDSHTKKSKEWPYRWVISEDINLLIRVEQPGWLITGERKKERIDLRL